MATASPFSGTLGRSGLACPRAAKNSPPAMTWVHDWTGPYAGLQIGMNVGDNGGTYSYVTPDGFFGTPSFNTNGYGVLAGGHLGYNKQFDQWVFGLEASADVTDINKAEQLGWNDPAYNGGSIDANISSYFQGSLRARAGYAWNRLLPYVTGGLAFGAFNVLSSAGGRTSSAILLRGGAGSFALAYRLDSRRGRRICDHASLVGARRMALLRFRPYRRDFDELLELRRRRSALLSGRSPCDAEPTAGWRELQIRRRRSGDVPDRSAHRQRPGAWRSAVDQGRTGAKAYAANWTGFYLGGQAGYAMATITAPIISRRRTAWSALARCGRMRKA